MNTKLMVGIVLASAMSLPSACEEADISRSEDGVLFLGAYEASATIERVIAPGDRSLELNGFAGSVRLIGDESDVARLQVRRRARGDTPAEAEAQLANLKIDETGDENTYRYVFAADDEAMSSFDIEGTVPVNTPLKIHWVSGSIDVGGIAADLEVRSRHGNVTYAGAASKVHLRTRNGEITAGLEAAGPQSDVDLVTANGDVTVSLSPNASVHVEASTSAGDISTGQLTFASESYVPMDAGAQFQGRLAEGAGRILLSTEYGSIHLDEYIPKVTVPAEAPDEKGQDAGTLELTAPDTVIAPAEGQSVPGTSADSLK